MLRNSTKSVLALALLGLLPTLATAQVTYPVRDVLFVNYFSNALGVVQPGPEQKVRILNPGLYQGVVAYQTTGNLCAFIYVFDRNQQLLECCGCLVTPSDAIRQNLVRGLLFTRDAVHLYFKFRILCANVLHFQVRPFTVRRGD